MVSQFLSRFLNGAPVPGRPLRVAALVLALFAVLTAAMAVANPSGLVPGMAEGSIDGSTGKVTFTAGDRYFWLPATPATPVSAKEFLAQIPGAQSVTQRDGFESTSRLVFDEDRNGPDAFNIRDGFLYEVAGIFSDVSVTYAADPSSIGKDFAGEVHEGANRFFVRLWSFIKGVPGMVWDDVQQIGGDIRDLFSTKKQNGQDGGPGPFQEFVQRAKDGAPLLGGLAVFLVVAPLLGFGSIGVGLVAGGALAYAGFWVLGAGAALAGFLFDNNQTSGPNPVQRLLIGAGYSFHDFSTDFPHLLGGIVVFLVAAAGAAGAVYLGHPNLAAVAVVIGGGFASLLIVQGGTRKGPTGERSITSRLIEAGGESRRGGTIASLAGFSKSSAMVERLGLLPAVLVLALGAWATFWLIKLGYAGLAWAFFFFEAALFIMYSNTMVVAAARARDSAESFAKRRYGRLHWWGKVGLVAIILGTLGTVAAFNVGESLVGYAYIVATLTILSVLLVVTQAPAPAGQVAEGVVEQA